jgi:hypothetical protein
VLYCAVLTRREQKGADAPTELIEHRYMVRADTGRGLHQLFDHLANIQLNGPPKRYAMGGGDERRFKKDEKRDTCSIDCTHTRIHAYKHLHQHRPHHQHGGC